jgi:hypothetical protein
MTAAAEISESELQDMIRSAIEQGLRPDIAECALAWLDRVEDLLAVLRVEMPDIVKEAKL